MKKHIVILTSIFLAIICMLAVSMAEGENNIIGVWKNAEMDIEMHLHADGTAYTVLQGDAGPLLTFEYDDQQFTVKSIGYDGSYNTETFNFTLDGDTMTLPQEIYISYDAEGNEIGRQEVPVGLVLTRISEEEIKKDELLGVWANEEQGIVLYLNADGTTVSVINGEVGPTQTLCYDNDDLSVVTVENGNIKTKEMYYYTISDDTLSLRDGTMVFYDENGVEYDNQKLDITLTLTRK